MQLYLGKENRFQDTIHYNSIASQLFMVCLWINYRQLNFLPYQTVFSQNCKHFIGMENRVAGSHKVGGNVYVNTKTAKWCPSIGAIFNSIYHTNHLAKSMAKPNCQSSQVVQLQMAVCMSRGDEGTVERPPKHCLTSLRNKPQEKQPL